MLTLENKEAVWFPPESKAKLQKLSLFKFKDKAMYRSVERLMDLYKKVEKEYPQLISQI